MLQQLCLVLVFLFSFRSIGSEIEYSRTQSSTSYSDKYKFNYTIDTQNKLGLSYRMSKDTSGTTDDFSSALKVNYRYKLDSGNSISVEFKKGDDYYFFEDNTIGINATFAVTDSTKLNFSFDASQQTYTKASNESFSQRTFSAGVDQEILSNISLGMDYSTNSYSATTLLMKRALSGIAILTNDITNYINTASGSSLSAYAEINIDDYSLGGSYTLDTTLVSNTASYTTEVYLDLILFKDWNLGLSYSKGKSETSSTPSETTSASLGYSF